MTTPPKEDRSREARRPADEAHEALCSGCSLTSKFACHQGLGTAGLASLSGGLGLLGPLLIARVWGIARRDTQGLLNRRPLVPTSGQVSCRGRWGWWAQPSSRWKATVPVAPPARRLVLPLIEGVLGARAGGRDWAFLLPPST